MSRLFSAALFLSILCSSVLYAQDPPASPTVGSPTPVTAAQQQPQPSIRDYAHAGGHSTLPPSMQNHPLHSQATKFQQQIDEDEEGVPQNKRKHSTKKLIGVAAATAAAGAILAQQGALDGLPIVGGKDGDAADGGDAGGGEAADAG